MEQHARLAESTPLCRSLEENLDNLLKFTDNSSDVIIKKGFVCGNKIAVVTCEGMTSTDTLAQLVYPKLNLVEDDRLLSPDALMDSFFNVFLIAAEQLDIKNLGDLTLKLQSGFAIILVDGCTRAIAIGVQGYKSRGIDEPSSELNVRGSREGFVEVIRTNMALIRRRIKSPTLVFELSPFGERSNTDICLCYISDKVSPKLLENVKKRLKSVKLNTILESGYIQPYFEGRGFSRSAERVSVPMCSRRSCTRGASAYLLTERLLRWLYRTCLSRISKRSTITRSGRFTRFSSELCGLRLI